MYKLSVIVMAGLILIHTSEVGATSTDGLVGYWSFDDPNNPGRDDSGNANDGTVYGATWKPGIVGGALGFDASGDCVSVADSASLRPVSLTIEAWIKPDTINPVTYGDRIISKAQNYTGYELSHYGTAGNYKLVAIIGRVSSWRIIVKVADLQLGVWQHVAMTYDGSTVELFLNGNSLGTGSSGAIPQSSDYPLFIGSHSGTQFFYDGLIDEVAIYDRALSDSEIAALIPVIKFSGYWWSVLQSEQPIEPGPNRFTDDPNDVWVDPNGHLHMSIVDKDPNWYCSEVITSDRLGYGTYAFTIKGDVNSLDPNIVLGLSIYDVNDANEGAQQIGVQFTRWANPDDPNNAQFAVPSGDAQRFQIAYLADTETTTHEITWQQDQIYFRSYYGDYPLKDSADIIATWCYAGQDIPQPGYDDPRISFYLLGGAPPTNGQDAEIVIKSFQFNPTCWNYLTQCHGDADNSGDVKGSDFLALKNSWYKCYPDPAYNSCADFDSDGCIKGSDFLILKANWYQPVNANCPPRRCRAYD